MSSQHVGTILRLKLKFGKSKAVVLTKDSSHVVEGAGDQV